jgi:hypothetical protein
MLCTRMQCAYARIALPYAMRAYAMRAYAMRVYTMRAYAMRAYARTKAGRVQARAARSKNPAAAAPWILHVRAARGHVKMGCHQGRQGRLHVTRGDTPGACPLWLHVEMGCHGSAAARKPKEGFGSAPPRAIHTLPRYRSKQGPA